MTLVAVHEVHRQWRDRARNLPMGALSLGTGDPGELSEPAAIDDDEVEEVAAAHLEHAERVADLAALKPAERTALCLQGARLPLPRDRRRHRRQLHGREPAPD